MKRLTVIASCCSLPTFIVGLYGQNFHHIPELDWQLRLRLVVGPDRRHDDRASSGSSAEARGSSARLPLTAVPYFICPNCKERSIDNDRLEELDDQPVGLRRCGFGFLFELMDDYYPAPARGSSSATRRRASSPPAAASSSSRATRAAS